MTYSDAMTETPMVCSQDGCVVQDTTMHDAGHRYAQGRWDALAERITALEEDMARELAETREDVADADARANRQDRRCGAAIRVAEAASSYLAASPGSAGQTVERAALQAALVQWELFK